MTIQDRQAQVIADFSAVSEWEARYKKIIEIGKSMPEMDEALKTEDNKVKGCQSQVWLSATLNSQGQMVLQCNLNISSR